MAHILPSVAPLRHAARFAAGSVAAALAWLAAPAAFAQAPTPPAPFSTWISNLTSMGYSVTQGSAQQFTVQYCKQAVLHVFQNCLGTSLNNPFVVMSPPDGAEFVDPKFGNAGVGTAYDGSPSNLFYQLDPRSEALLVVLNVPPTSAYYSYQSYVFTRPIAYYGAGWKGKPSPDRSRAQLFASFNNSINNVQIAQTAGFAFNSGTVAFITTANTALASALTQAFVASGGSASQVFTEAVAPDASPAVAATNLGLGSNYDQLLTVFRYSLPEDEEAGSAWLSNTTGNMFVYRIDAPSSLTYEPFQPVSIATKSFNTDEGPPHQANLTELANILAGWLGTQQTGPIHVDTAASSLRISPNGTIAGVIGPICIADGTFCTGDQQDTDAYKYVSVGNLPGTSLAIVAGVDHTTPSNNNATYVNAAMQDDNYAVRIADNSDVNAAVTGFSGGGLGGSALQVLTDLNLLSQASPALQADLPNLYVGFFTRSCLMGAAYCGQPYTTVLPKTIGQVDQLQIVERAYVLPGYFNGADPNDLVAPIVIY